MAIVDEAMVQISGIPLKDAFVVIVRTVWNAAVVDVLEQGAINVLQNNQVSYKIIEVPGAFEIPFAIKQHHHSGTTAADAYLALGCVIRGGTPHFEYVCQAVTAGVLQLNLLLPVPVIFGILTVDNQVQADERAGGRHGNKGQEAAITAIKMIQLNKSFNVL